MSEFENTGDAIRALDEEQTRLRYVNGMNYLATVRPEPSRLEIAAMILANKQTHGWVSSTWNAAAEKFEYQLMDHQRPITEALMIADALILEARKGRE